MSVDSLCKVITDLNNFRFTTIFDVTPMYVYEDNLNALGPIIS